MTLCYIYPTTCHLCFDFNTVVFNSPSNDDVIQLQKNEDPRLNKFRYRYMNMYIYIERCPGVPFNRPHTQPVSGSRCTQCGPSNTTNPVPSGSNRDRASPTLFVPKNEWVATGSSVIPWFNPMHSTPSMKHEGTTTFSLVLSTKRREYTASHSVTMGVPRSFGKSHDPPFFVRTGWVEVTYRGDFESPRRTNECLPLGQIVFSTYCTVAQHPGADI